MNTVLSLNSNVKAMNVEIFTKPMRNWASSLTLVAMFLSFSQWGIGQSCPVAPTISAMVFNPTDPCQNVNHDISGITIIPATPGVNYEYRYSLDGGPFVGNSSFGGIPVGPHCFGVKVFATAAVACGMPLTNYTNGDEIPGTLRTYCMYFGSSGPPAIAANNIAGNTLCVTSITPTPVPNRPCFTYEYSVDGGAWSSVVPIPVTPGCHTLQNRVVCGGLSGGSFGCFAGAPSPASAATDFSIFHDLAAIPDASITINRTCSSGANGSITSITGLPAAPAGFVYQYSVDNAAFSATFPTNLVPGCHNVTIIQVADCNGSNGDGITPVMCRKALNFVIYPFALVISATTNTCASMFTLPSVPPIGGFSVEYSLDGGAWTANPSTTTPGCHTIAARYVTEGCIAPPYNEVPAGEFSDGTISSCTAPSNTVSMVISPQITAVPTSASKSTVCGAANITFNWVAAPTSPLPGTAPAGGSFSLRYDIDGGTAFTNTTGIFPGVSRGCHVIEARYVLTTDCGTSAAPAVAPAACGVSRTFIVWTDISGSTPSVSLNNNCGASVNVSAVTFSPALPFIPAGQEVVFSGVNNGVAFGPVNLAGLTAINFVPGSHSISARLRATAACGVAPDGASVNDLSPATCGTALINFITFPAPPTITLSSAPSTNVQTVVLNNPITNITYNTTGATGATFSGLPPGVMGAWSGNMVTISGAPNSNAMSPYNYTVTLTGGCNTVTAMGTITVIVGVAQIMGGSGYGTLQQAIDAAVDGDTIMLLQNVSETNVMFNKSVILDAGAFTLTASGLTIPSGKYMRWLTNTLTIPATFSITNMGMLWNNGTITHVGPFTNAGTYKGTGTFNGNFTNNGSMQPGN